VRGRMDIHPSLPQKNPYRIKKRISFRYTTQEKYNNLASLGEVTKCKNNEIVSAPSLKGHKAPVQLSLW